jgi:hypothetical protein
MAVLSVIWLIWLCFRFVPAYSVEFERRGLLLPLVVRLVVFTVNWLIRSLPFLVLFAVAAAFLLGSLGARMPIQAANALLVALLLVLLGAGIAVVVAIRSSGVEPSSAVPHARTIQSPTLWERAG